MIKDFLQDEVTGVISELYPEWSGRVEVAAANNESFGDYAVTAVMSIAKQLEKNPRELANEVARKLKESKPFMQVVERVSVDGPGFVNLTVKETSLWREGMEYISNSQRHPNSPGAGKRVMVEFSSPNIAKPFNVGHLRSTIIGDSVAKIFEYLGYTVLRDNHLGDWGTQYGKLAYAVERWGDWQKIEADPIPELFALYVRFHQEEGDDPSLAEAGRTYFKRLEDGDEQVVELWKKLVELSLADFGQLYDMLGVRFDMQLGESFYEPLLADVIKECHDAGIAKKSQGAVLIFYDEPQLADTPLMIEKSNGTSTYGTRDLAGIKYRLKEFDLDYLYLEMGNEQQHYMRQVIKAAEMMGWAAPGQVVHIGHGLFMLPTGKMSTRRGETIWVKDLIADLKKRTAEVMADRMDEEGVDWQKVVSQIAIGALKYNDLSQSRNSTVVFNKDKALSIEGNSAPYLQYSISRGRKILRLAGQNFDLDDWVQTTERVVAEADGLTAHERSLLVHLTRFADEVERAAVEYMPSTLARYLFQLAQKYNGFYQNDAILSEEGVTRERRLLLVYLTVTILTQGLGLLGIESPERM